MSYSVNVYYNTGFNNINIPYDANVIRQATVKHYDNAYYFREDLDKPYVDLKGSYKDVRDVDYVEMVNNDTGEQMFFFATPSALAKNTVRLNLTLDALTTMGGAGNLNYTDGWQTRGHIKKEEDVIFDNVYPEPFQPKKELKCTDLVEVHGNGTADDLSIVYTNTNLTLMATAEEGSTDTVEVYTGLKGTEEVMYFPKITSPKVSTKFSCYDFKSGNYKSYNVTGAAAYSLDSWVTQEAIEKMHSMGITDLTASYFVPGEYSITNPIVNENKGTSTAAVYGELKGINTTKTISTLPYIYKSGIKNKKVFSLYNNYILSNVASSSSDSKNASELYNNDLAPSVNIWADLSPSGTPFARFSHITTSTNQYDSVVKGSQWNNNQINLIGGAGSIWNSLNASFSQANIDRSKMTLEIDKNYAQRNNNVMSSLYDMLGSSLAMNEDKSLLDFNPFSLAYAGIGFAGTEAAKARQDIVSGINNILDIAGSNAQIPLPQVYNYGALSKASDAYNTQNERYKIQSAALQQQVNENALGEIRANKLVAPTAMFSPSPSLSIYGYNYFVVQQVRLDDSDAERLDKFFQRFGYSGLERPLTKDCFDCRDYYTYVQAYNVNIKSSYGMRIRNAGIAQLNNGVRVWKVLPDSKYYDLN